MNSTRGGLPLLIGGVVAAVIGVVLTVIDQPSLWYFALFAAGTVAALVGVARMSHARAQRRRSIDDSQEDEQDTPS
jgi:membrane protein implicated in regulation of membrane protease activity